jgi:hypothetical protein
LNSFIADGGKREKQKNIVLSFTEKKDGVVKYERQWNLRTRCLEAVPKAMKSCVEVR